MARFASVELGAFEPEHRLAQTWRAVKNATVEANRTATAPDARFGVFLELEAPAGALRWVEPGLLKSLIDGVACAFQNHHMGHETVGNVAARIATEIGGDPEDIEANLLSDERAVICSQQRLVYRRSTGVQWNPADNLCIAGQVLRNVSDRWRLGGRICSWSPGIGISN